MMGFVKLDRQLMEHWLWNSKPFSKGQAWIDLVFLATHKNEKFMAGETLIDGKRGNVYRSKSWLAERWGWSRGRVDRFLKMLQKENMIDEKRIRIGTTNGTVITIVNYGKFQDVRAVKRAVNEQSTNSQRTVGGHIQEPNKEPNKEGIRNNMPSAEPEEEILDREELYGVDPAEQYRRFLAGELNLEDE